MQLAALDMAGTTVDEQGLVYKALRQSVEERDVPVSDEDFYSIMGHRKDTAIAILLEKGGLTPDPLVTQETYTRFGALLTEYYETTPPRAIDGAEETFITLREQGVKVVLTTGFSTAIATSIVNRLGWASTGPSAIIDGVISADTVAAGRPAPYLIHRAMELTGVYDVREVAVAGDTIADLRAGHNSGASIIAGVLTGDTPKVVLMNQPHTHILASVVDLPVTLQHHLD